MIRIVIRILLVLMLAAAPAAGQEDGLRTVEQLAGQGRLTDARAALERWGRDYPESDGLPGELRAYALLLGARLAVDPAVARDHYLAVALGYPTASAAPEALLRLGQGLVAEAETGASTAARAAGYLERLVSDYPGNAFRPAGLLWLVRARRLAGREAQACTAARQALAVGVADPDIQELIRLEAAAFCATQ